MARRNYLLNMKVKGTKDFEISKEKLWELLMDPIVLAKITPGISTLEFVQEDEYKAISEIKIGPVKSKFAGQLKVLNKIEHETFEIGMVQESKIGNAHANIKMIIKDGGEGKSSLEFEGLAKLSGVLARTGQRVLSGVANSITKQVFKNLDEHIKENKLA